MDDPVRFLNALRAFAGFNIRKGIKTIFVLEANSIEFTPGDLRLHPIMRQVGLEKNIPVLDLHGYLALNFDRGFLWWDFVHLTSFGQNLAAGILTDWISQELFAKKTVL